MQTHDTSNMRIVLVDDDAMMLKAVQEQLRSIGFSSNAFEDASKAIEYIREHGADIVISDILMPTCDGFEVLRNVKEVDPLCDVIFMTGHGELETAVRALRAGATDFFEKPFTGAALLAAIERTRKYRIASQQAALLASRVDLLRTELTNRTVSRHVMLGRSAQMRRVAQDVIDVASGVTTVLITGESGTGKELVALGLHTASPRHDAPFLAVNCPSIPEELFESELFGHRKGAFTGAIETRSGYVDAARGGTLFLDEIGDMPLKTQAKILRLLEQRTYLPIGEQKERSADVRIVAATNQPLEQLVREKKFREDLYYRLNVFKIEVPPLRHRMEDVPVLAFYFTLQYAAEMGKQIEGLGDDAIERLMSYGFPGNVRELRNVIESAVIHCKHGSMLQAEHLPDSVRAADKTPAPATTWPLETLKLDEVERYLYNEALNRTGQNISAAARLIGLSRGKMRRRMEALKMDPGQ